MSEGKTWTFRLAEASDADAFAEWVKSNPQIDLDDVRRTIKGANPTCVTFVACCDGVPVAFAPFYATMHLAHLGLSPDARASEKLKALEVLRDGAMAFAVQFGIREINTLTHPEYGVAKWAEAHGFEKDSRELYRLDLNKEMAAVKAE